MRVARSSAAQLIRSARVAAGLTQEDLSTRAGTSEVELADYERGVRSPDYAIFERLLSAAGQRVITVPGIKNNADDTSTLIGDALKRNDAERAFRCLIDYSDGLHANDGVDRVLLTVTEPDATGSPLWDAAIAAVSDYWLSKDKLPLPRWISSGSRKLAQPQSLIAAVNKYSHGPELKDVSEEFLRHNVLLSAATLGSV